MASRVTKTMLGGFALAAVAVMANPLAASAATGTATLTGGTLTMTAPATVSFSATLAGAFQNVTAPQSIDVLDNTGSAAGWNITLTSTTFTDPASDTLPNTAASDLSATGTCDVVAGCTLANNSAISYPVAVPAAASAPVAVKIQTAAVSTGLSGQTWAHSMQLGIPATARAGAYSSTWTYSLTSGP